MGLQVIPGYIGQSGYNHPVELFRNILKAQTAGGALAGWGKGMMRASTDFALTPSGSALSLTIDPGWAAILGEESNSQGSYFVWSNAAESLVWPAASGQPRIDSLVCRVIDTQYGTDPSPNGALWEIVQGTPAASPTMVADVEFAAGGDFHRPGAWWRVANVLIEPGDTTMSATTITDLRQYADFQRSRHNILYTWKTDVESAWTAFTPTFTAASGSPAFGNSTVMARYKQVGKLVTYQGRILWGTTANYGGAGWGLSLPVAARTTEALFRVGSAYFRDASGTSSGHFPGICLIDITTAPDRMVFFNVNAQVGSAYPFPWTSTDHLTWSLQYEAA